MKAPAFLTSMWEKTPPRQRQIGVVVIACAVLFTIIALISPEAPEKRPRQKQVGTLKSVLTETNSRSLTIDGLSSSITHLRDENERKDKLIETLKTQVSSLQESDRKTVKQEQLDKLNSKLRALDRELMQQKKLTQNLKNSAGVSEIGVTDTGNNDGDEPKGAKVFGEQGIFDENPLTTSASNNSGKPGRNGGSTAQQGIMFVSSKEPAKQESNERVPDIYIPAGSIISGTLITGMDAQTNASAMRDPMPALIRVQDETIMPNLYRSDIRECFMLLGGYGDLSTERAFLRSETLSCIHENGNVLEIGIEGYAAGEDGKAGVRGRLVTKNGQLIAQTMMAGFLQGWAGTLETENNDYLAQFASAVNGDTSASTALSTSERTKNSALAGVGKSMDRLAEFFLDMAENIYPVIEVDAGRKIEIVLVSGASIDFGN